MIKKFLPHFLPVLMINLIASPIATFIFLILAKSLGSGFEITVSIILVRFAINFLTTGFILGIIYFELGRKNEYYFYYNLGISKLRLIFTTFLFHVILMIPILIIAVYAKDI